MITKRDQERLSAQIDFIEKIITEFTEQDCVKVFRMAKDEIIQINMNYLKYMISDLR